MPVSASSPTDLPELLAITRAVSVFNAEEVATVKELFDAYVQDAEASGYRFLSYREGEAVLGFACWGPTDLSRGAADLYWIVTAPQAHGRGVARSLFQAVIESVQALGRWLIVIWTSGRSEYEPARQFYQRMGCTLAARIPDFYERGDDLYIYTRQL
jgi:GNAT superfamily N-acetyltransferase